MNGVFPLLSQESSMLSIYVKLYENKIFYLFNQQVEMTKLQQKNDELEASLKDTQRSAQVRVNLQTANNQMQHQLINIMPHI